MPTPAKETAWLADQIAKAETDLKAHQDSVNYWLTIEDFLENEDKREVVFELLQI
jgi:hypothetical protein